MSMLYQVALLQSLVNGYYDGIISVKKLKELGDVGIGTFDGANGELIYLDSKVYRARIDGEVEEVDDNETIPFCNSCKFSVDGNVKLSAQTVITLKTVLNRYRDRDYKNLFIAFRIKGLFKKMVVRTIPKQNKPYNPLEKVVENDQKIFNYKNVEGTIIGFLFPRYMSDLNTTDCHMHFLSDDRKCGGHVLDLEFDNLNLELSIKKEFKLILPNNDKFNNYNVVINKNVMKKVEE